MEQSSSPILSNPVRRHLPRVLDVITIQPSKKFGSLEEQLVFLSEAFAKEGSAYIPVFNCEPNDADISQFTRRGTAVECIDLRKFRLRTLLQFRGLIRKHRAQIVQWNFLHPLFNSYRWALGLLHPRVRHWYKDRISRTGLREQASFLKRWMKYLFLGRYERIICVSNYVQNLLREQGGDAGNLVTQHHFVNTERFRPDFEVRQAVREELGSGSNVVLIAVGHLIADKGMDVTLRAFAQLPDSVQLWIIGTGSARPQLEQLSQDLGVQARVRFLGLQAQVQRFLQAADVFICPSLWAEAAGFVTIEAQACGVPVLASRIGGIPEYVEDECSGWLFTPGSVEELRQRLIQIISDPVLRQQMGQAARQVALDRFSPQVCVPQLLDLYRLR